MNPLLTNFFGEFKFRKKSQNEEFPRSVTLGSYPQLREYLIAILCTSRSSSRFSHYSIMTLQTLTSCSQFIQIHNLPLFLPSRLSPYRLELQLHMVKFLGLYQARYQSDNLIGPIVVVQKKITFDFLQIIKGVYYLIL